MASPCHCRRGAPSGKFDKFPCAVCFRSSPFHIAGAHHSKPESYLSFLSHDVNNELLNYAINISSPQPRTFFVLATRGSCSYTIHNTDFSASFIYHNVNRCDADVSLTFGLSLWYRRKVRHSFHSRAHLSMTLHIDNHPKVLAESRSYIGTKLHLTGWR